MHAVRWLEPPLLLRITRRQLIHMTTSQVHWPTFSFISLQVHTQPAGQRMLLYIINHVIMWCDTQTHT